MNQLMPWLGATGGGAGGAALGGPAGAAIGSTLGMLATQAAPPAVRSVILSPTYQRLMANPQTKEPAMKLMAELLRNKAVQTMTPAAGALTAAGMQQ